VQPPELNQNGYQFYLLHLEQLRVPSIAPNVRVFTRPHSLR